MVQVGNPQVSGIHGQLVCRDGTWSFEDLKSTNGSLIRRDDTDTVIDGTSRVTAEVKTGDRLSLCDLKAPVVFYGEYLYYADTDIVQRPNNAPTVADQHSLTCHYLFTCPTPDDPTQ